MPGLEYAWIHIRLYPRHPRDPCAIVIHLWFICDYLRLRISFYVAHIFQTPPSNAKTPPAPILKPHPSPQLILAGAGTGKITTITAKIAYMVEKENIDPSRILALTFSKEAARNMLTNAVSSEQGRSVALHSCSGTYRAPDINI